MIVCVTGMHRSGTSALARVLNILGMDLGDPKQLMKPHPEQNARGFWEHWAFVRLNDRILKECGGTWDRPPSIVRRQPQFVADARKLLQEFSSADLRGWKDPRTAITFPVWKAAARAAGLDLRTVVSIRHPDQVAASLQKRNLVTAERARELWRRHYRSIAEHTDPKKRTCVHYEDLLQDWRRALLPLRDLVPLDNRVAEMEIDEFLARELQHHAESPPLTEEDMGILRMLGSP